MDMLIRPSLMNGEMQAIASKSHAHRLLICSALADRKNRIRLPQSSADIEATIDCLQAMGANIAWEDGVCLVEPLWADSKNILLDCAESGSTLRFLLPVAAAHCSEVAFQGAGRLPKRPLDPLIAVLESHGISFSDHHLPLTIRGHLQAGQYLLPGNISSQYITGLLLALPGLAGNSRIILTTELESASYVEITLAALRNFSVNIIQEADGYSIPGRQIFRSPGEITVDGDWSNGAFFLVAGALGGGITLRGLDYASPQGDKAIIDLLRRFGADLQIRDAAVRVSPGTLCGCEIDLTDIPDLLPILAVLAAFAQGESRFINGGRLRLKESDRLQTTAAMLKALGGEVIESRSGLIVQGHPLRGGLTESFGDHRIAMAAAVAAASCVEPVLLADAEAVNKSYPGFFDDYQKLGGIAYVI